GRAPQHRSLRGGVPEDVVVRDQPRHGGGRDGEVIVLRREAVVDGDAVENRGPGGGALDRDTATGVAPGDVAHQHGAGRAGDLESVLAVVPGDVLEADRVVGRRGRAHPRAAIVVQPISLDARADAARNVDAVRRLVAGPGAARHVVVQDRAVVGRRG